MTKNQQFFETDEWFSDIRAALFCKKQLYFHMINALKENRWSPDIVQKLGTSFYVDNCTTSLQSCKELNHFILQAREIMATEGFDLRKWEFTHDFAEKTTKLVWSILFNIIHGTLSINTAVFNIRNPEIVTKRIILSDAHKIFDPLAFTSLVMLLPKLLLRRLYKQKIDWDQPIDE